MAPWSRAAAEQAINREMPGVRADLARLIRIPGIAFDGFDHTHVERSAAAVAELARGCGLQTDIVRAGGQPAVLGHRPAPPGAHGPNEGLHLAEFTRTCLAEALLLIGLGVQGPAGGVPSPDADHGSAHAGGGR